MLRALGFDPTKEEIVKLIRDLGKGETKFDTTKIDFQEFLEICPTLKILDVTNCGVGPKGCEMLAESLLKNKECRLTEFYASRDRLEDSISYLGKVFI